MSRGGSRFGAGRPAHKGKDHHCRRLDVRSMARARVLRSGVSGGWGWTDKTTGKVLASISYQCDGDSLGLDFTVNGRPVSQRVPLTSTQCHLGGERQWFRCPCCQSRVALLYLRFDRFACRRCNLLAYQSQSEDECGRSWIKQSRIEARLWPDNGKRARMTRKTTDRLLAQILACEEVRDQWLAVVAARLFPGIA